MPDASTRRSVRWLQSTSAQKPPQGFGAAKDLELGFKIEAFTADQPMGPCAAVPSNGHHHDRRLEIQIPTPRGRPCLHLDHVRGVAKQDQANGQLRQTVGRTTLRCLAGEPDGEPSTALGGELRLTVLV